jgi:anti-sigma-K factor RskA
MDHMRFKANMTAATYVAHDLDERAQEDFELHLMSCAECVEDVESWRAIEKHMPREAAAAAPRAAVHPTLKHWRLAASLIGVGIVGAAGGWYGRSVADSELERTAFFNAAPLTRGAFECTALKFDPQTERIVVRVAGVASDREVVARALSGDELGTRGYSARRQLDGSWLLQFTPATLARGAIRLESVGGSGAAEPLGCLSAQPAP